MLEDVAFFSYQDTRLYRYNKTLYRQEFKGELYITKNEMVFYDRVNNKISKIISISTIKEVVLKKFAVEMNITDEDTVYLRYKDNELIFISLSRLLPTKLDIDFLSTVKEDSDTIEKTIESFLDIKSKS